MEGRYTIILLPEGSLGRIISKIRDGFQNITKRPSVPAHVTLREDFFSKDIDKFIEEFKDKISGLKPLKLKFTNIEVFQRGHVVYKVENKSELQKLHEITVKTSQKHVSTPKIRTFECELNEEQKEIVKKYQLPFYFKYYTPHMTIVRLNEFKDKEKILELINEYDIPTEFNISNVCIYDKLKHKIYQLIKL